MLAIFVISVSLLVNLLRGSKRTPSIIAIEKCGQLDWTIFSIYIIFSITLSFIGVLINHREQNLKRKVGKGIVQSDL